MNVRFALLLVLVVPVNAASQTVAASFEQLQTRQTLTKGETILIDYTVPDGDENAEIRGSFVALTGSTITVQPDSGPQLELLERDVLRITRERKDTVWKGAFIGGGVGLGYGAFSTISFCSSAWECEAGPMAGYILVMSGIGFAVGAAIDAARGKTQQELVYVKSSPATPSVDVSVFPILSPTGRGVGIRVTW